MFDTGQMDRPLNYEMPDGRIPMRPLAGGRTLVIARLHWSVGEEWRPVFANRWTKTHVLVVWIEDGKDKSAWLRAEDVKRVLRSSEKPV
jgi:hypothetical protein